MRGFSIFLIVMVPIFVSRMLFRARGRSFAAIFLALAHVDQIFFLGQSVWIAILPWVVGIFTFMTVRNLPRLRQKTLRDEDLLLLLDGLALQMSAGAALSASFRQILRNKPHLMRHFGTDDLSLDVRSAHKQTIAFKEVLEQLQLAQKSPSLAYETVIAVRETQRLRVKLHAKQRVLTAQATAQGVVVALLYVLILIAQLRWNSDFTRFLDVSLGKVCLVASGLLIFGGIFLLRVLSRPRELEI